MYLGGSFLETLIEYRIRNLNCIGSKSVERTPFASDEMCTTIFEEMSF